MTVVAVAGPSPELERFPTEDSNVNRIQRLIGCGLGVAWAAGAVAAEPAKPTYVPGGYGSFTDGAPAPQAKPKPAPAAAPAVQQAVAVQPTPPARTPAPQVTTTVIEYLPHVPKPAPTKTTKRPTKPTPVAYEVVPALPVMAPAPAPTAAPAPSGIVRTQAISTEAPSGLPSVTAPPLPTPPRPVSVTPPPPPAPPAPLPAVTAQQVRPAPVPQSMPVGTIVTVADEPKEMKKPEPTPMPAPIPAPAPAPAPVPYAAYPVATPNYAPQGNCSTCGANSGCETGCNERPRGALFAKLLGWWTYRPCPALVPTCLPTPYQAPLQSYFPCTAKSSCVSGCNAVASCDRGGCRTGTLARLKSWFGCGSECSTGCESGTCAVGGVASLPAPTGGNLAWNSGYQAGLMAARATPAPTTQPSMPAAPQTQYVQYVPVPVANPSLYAGPSAAYPTTPEYLAGVRAPAPAPRGSAARPAAPSAQPVLPASYGGYPVYPTTPAVYPATMPAPASVPLTRP